MIRTTVGGLFLAILLITTACIPALGSSLPVNESQLPTATSKLDGEIIFPRQKKTNGEWAAMDALTRGTLVLIDNCIRLERDQPLANYLVIWPPDFYLNNKNGTIQIMDKDGNIAAFLGDEIEISGGEMPSFSMLDKSIQEQLPPKCGEPYWLMGYEFTRINP